ncbi:TRPM8 channel-associated factor 2-like [Lingula anatina]|uniref:TRPM8 channel-associated factor 2-like n=1 Tax=Lingula anatina TaxID=7574 RepID=A0A1S3I0H4_LINAN|nr:TRPM8 channel-associated factor 2-like [Lingula anatina]|eukprot:XP_013390849.1 TRPM8 channel-associated factor 2-like [Lingula anatina]
MSSWTKELLQGVEAVPVLGTPGRLAVVGERAEPVLTSKHSEEVAMAAAEYGTGRVVVFSHDSYVLKYQINEPRFRILNANITRWLTRNWRQTLEHVDLKEISFGCDLPPPGSCVLLWHLDPRKPTAEFTEAVLAHLQYGGFLVCGMCPWGWLQLNPGKTLDELPHSPVLARLGLSYIQGYVNGQSLNVNDNMAQWAHIGRAIEDVSRDLNRSEKYVELLSGMSLIPQSFRSLIFKENLIGYLNPAQLESNIPSPKSPANTSAFRASVRVLGMLYRMTPPQAFCKLPGIGVFPGDFSSKPPLQTVRLNLTTKHRQRLSTGYYVPAGQPVKVTVTSDQGTDLSGWKICIGAHDDSLVNVKEPWRRWPDVAVLEELKATTALSSPYGGLLFFDSPERNAELTVIVCNVVEAPFFDLTKPEIVEDWSRRRNAPGLWAELAGRHIVFTVPSTSVREIDDPTTILALWDSAVAAQHDLRGTDRNLQKRERVVADEQPSAGYMHAGYPIVTHLDVVDPNFQYNGSDNFVFSESGMKSYGNWGLFHEIGHNMQRKAWTFSGMGEVTNNIFTLYTYEAVTGNDAWNNPTMKKFRAEKLPRLLQSQPSLSDWKKDPFFALCVYSQLAHEFGWRSFKTVFRLYENSVKKEEESNQDDGAKIDMWFGRFSEIVRHNLSPMCDFWGIPLSTGVRNNLTLFPAFLPNDEITAAGQARVDQVLPNYPGIVRSPSR